VGILILSVFIIYAASQASQDQTIFARMVSGFFALPGIMLWLEFHLVRIEFDNKLIYTFSPWRTDRVILWEDIIGYAFSDLNQWHILNTSSQGKIRLSVLLSGLVTFFEALSKHSAGSENKESTHIR
jgi:hypothetical protein